MEHADLLPCVEKSAIYPLLARRVSWHCLVIFL